MTLLKMIQKKKVAKKKKEQLIALTTTGMLVLTQSAVACADEAPEAVNGSDQANVQDVMDSIENSSENSTDKSENEFKSSFLEDSKDESNDDKANESTNKSEDTSDSNIEEDNTKDESDNGFKSSFLEDSKEEFNNDKTDTSNKNSEDKSKEESTNKSESKNEDKSEGESKSDKKDESDDEFKSSFLEDNTDTSKDKSEEKSDDEFKSSFLEDSKEESDGEFKSSFLSKKDDKSDDDVNDESSNEFKSSFLEDNTDTSKDKSEEKSDNEFKSSFLDNTADESNDDEDQFVSMMNDQSDEDEDEDTKTIVETMTVVDMSKTLDEAVAKKKGSLNMIGNTKRHANVSEIKEYLNPETYLNNEKYKFAFLDIGQFREFDYKVFDEYLEKIQPNHNGDTVLRGKGKVFVEAARKYNIDPVYLFAHGMVESDHGRSPLCKGAYSVVLNSDGKAKKNGKACEYVSSSKVASDSSKYKKVYNFFGIGAYDLAASVGGVTMAYNQNWFSVEEAIEGSAKWIAENYIHTTKRAKQNTLYSMRWNFINPDRQYASDIYWASTISSIMYKFKDGYVNNDFTYIVPEYTGQNLSLGEDKPSDTKEDKKDESKDEVKNDDTSKDKKDESDDVKSDTEQESDDKASDDTAESNNSKEAFKTEFDINGDYLDVYRDYANDEVKKDKITLSGVVKSIVTPIIEVVGNAVGLEVSTKDGVNNDGITTNIDNSQSEGNKEGAVDVKTGIETADSLEEVLIKAGLK